MNERKYLPLNRREERVRFSLTARDVEILQALSRFRYLRTGQIRRLLFSDNRTVQATRRRLKYLYHSGFIGRIMPLVRVGEGAGEVAYYLERAGREMLQKEGRAVTPAKVGQVRHQFLAHALDISEFRANLELSLRDNPAVAIHRFTADFELKGFTRKVAGKHRYKLYDEVLHKISQKRYVVYPDALIILSGKGRYEGHQKLFLLEIDRGTEGLRVIRDKVIGYDLYRRQGLFKKYGKVSDFTVLLQTSSKKRAENIRSELTGLSGTDLVWVTDVQSVNPQSLLHKSIWQDWQGNYKSVLKSK